MEKIALGINLPFIIYKGLNDYYIRGVEFKKADKKSKLFRKVKRKIFIHNILVHLCIKRWDLLMCVICKDEICDDIKRKYILNNWKIKELPRNPYIDCLDEIE